MPTIAFALRMLSRRPGFFVVSVLTIALGVGGTTAVFSAVDAVLLKPLPYQAPGQLVRIYQSNARNPGAQNFVTAVHFLTYRAQASTLQGVAATNTYDQTGGDIGAGDQVRRIRTLQVSADYFDVLRAPPALGRGFSVDEENGPDTDEAIGAPVIILSDRLWRERYRGDPGALGATLVMSGAPFTVVGVMRYDFVDPIAGREIDAWVPLDLTTGRNISNINNHWLTLIGRLRTGVTVLQAQSELDGVTERLSQPYPARQDDRTRLLPLREDVVGTASRSLTLLLGAVALVLLLVCVNIATLQLVRGSERAREFAVRAAMGAGRGRLVRQLLTESLVLAAFGGMVGLAVARLSMSALVTLGSASIPRLSGLSLAPRVLLVAGAVATASAVLFGLAPAWHAARTEPGDVLRGGGRANTGDRAQGRVRGALVVSQVALAFVLLSGAGVLLASFRAIMDQPLGVKPAGVLAFQVHLPDARYDSIGRAGFFERFDARIQALPGVSAAGGVSWLPATGDFHSWWVNALTGPLAGSQPGSARGGAGAENRVVTPGYFKALGIPVLAGRPFDEGDRLGAPDRVMISKNLADQIFPGIDPLGQQVRTGGRTSTVIGVVGDVAVNPEGRLVSYVYRAHAQFAGDRNWALFEVVATGGNPLALAPAVRRALGDLDPQLVLDHPAPLADVIERGTAQRKFTLITLLAFAATALVLAALGVFGVLAYTVRLRGQEFGIRLALGASPAAIVRGVLRQGAVVIGAGVGLGLAGAVALSRVVTSMVFHVSPLDPRVLGAAAVVLGTFGGVAAYLPARRAAGADPRSVLE